MEFQVIYSRKIEGSVSAFTGVIFAFQYGLTRETVAENFSRTGIDWSEFILYVSVGLLLIFLFWNDDYQQRGLHFEELFFIKNINGVNFHIVEFVMITINIQLIKMRNYCIFLRNQNQIGNLRRDIIP